MRTLGHLLGATLLVGFLLSSTGSSAQSGMKYYVTWSAAGGQNIRGSVIQKGRENTTLGHSLSHEVFLPRDASGAPTGKLQHKPMSMVLDLDAATTSLMTVLAQNGVIPTVTIRCYKAGTTTTGGAGTEVQYYTMTLTNATIGSIQTAIGPGTPTNQFESANTNSTTGGGGDLIRITLYYQQINTTYTGAGSFQGNF